MVNPELEFLASVAGKGSVRLAHAKEWLGDFPKPQKALFRLERAGLVFPLTRGEYAVPSKAAIAEALAVRLAPVRLAAWLPEWIRGHEHHERLARGLTWTDARFLGLGVHMLTDLVWTGPQLLVPISPDAERIEGLHHRVPVFAYDPADPGVAAKLPNGGDALAPSKKDIVRILAVHNDPRLREAALRLAREVGDAKELQALVARTDPPTPFTDPKTRLPRGPPFRYRLFAPISWVKRNLSYGKPPLEDWGGA